jgi:hypothetical protein
MFIMYVKRGFWLKSLLVTPYIDNKLDLMAEGRKIYILEIDLIF